MSLQVETCVSRGDFELDLALEAQPGRTIALLGPNGAGKSTLVAVLAGLLHPARGRVVLDGAVLEDPGRGIHVPPAERQVGVMFQDLLLFPHLTATENIAFPLRARGVPRADARLRASALLERLGILHRRSARPGQLSGGEAQRVALARALVAEPRLLLLDEPLSALDVRARSEIRELVRDTLDAFDGVRILITHDPLEAMTLAHRLVLVEGGRITQEGTPDELRDAPRTAYAAELVGVNLFAGRLVGMEEGVGRLQTADGPVTVALDETIGPADRAVGILRPTDVSLFLARPEGSARNVVAGAIRSVTQEGERARIRLDSHPPVVAEVTMGSVRRLGLRPGIRVWASFKAVEVRLVPF
jgi:molybdate transport system ATP-binding protein